MTHTETIVTRTIRLAGPASAEAIGNLHAEGLVVVKSLAGGTRVEVAYDPRRLRLDTLRILLAGAGLLTSQGFFARLAWKWGAFQENNVRAQAAAVHHCCSVPPAGKS